MFYAFEFCARDRAGLRLAGSDFNGDLQWIGTTAQWRQVERLEGEILAAA